MLDNGQAIYLIEETLFFKEFAFHKMKLAFHRASMKYYQDYLVNQGAEVHYIESADPRSDIRKLFENVYESGIDEIAYINPTDNWLEQRIQSMARRLSIQLKEFENPLFINSRKDLEDFFKPDKQSFFQTIFYKQQRKKNHILLDDENQPLGGQWSFDSENRKKYPKAKTPPVIDSPLNSHYWQEALDYVQHHFTHNPGALSDSPIYPVTHKGSDDWLGDFLHHRFIHFGDYEDAIVQDESFLHHSVLSPMLNVGLIQPRDVLDLALSYAEKEGVPINSLEGFVRQLIGWREFIRGMYEIKGTYSRSQNFWGFKRPIPASFYTAETGIEPVDITIQKVLKTGYCHHIERLMVLGNFMLLCEFDPNEVYRWFMELFIDAYDWVMVPNVYGMSQFADGGLFATKPYISGSNYLRKMSDYTKGEWQETWDGLFWRFMHTHRDFFLQNPRLAMLVRTFDNMDPVKQNAHITQAEIYLSQLN